MFGLYWFYLQISPHLPHRDLSSISSLPSISSTAAQEISNSWCRGEAEASTRTQTFSCCLIFNGDTLQSAAEVKYWSISFENRFRKCFMKSYFGHIQWGVCVLPRDVFLRCHAVICSSNPMWCKWIVKNAIFQFLLPFNSHRKWRHNARNIWCKAIWITIRFVCRGRAVNWADK
jgi:hypothetical protein